MQNHVFMCRGEKKNAMRRSDDTRPPESVCACVCPHSSGHASHRNLQIGTGCIPLHHLRAAQKNAVWVVCLLAKRRELVGNGEIKKRDCFIYMRCPHAPWKMDPGRL